MAVNLCDSLLANDIQGYDCGNPMTKGVERYGVIINRADIQLDGIAYSGAQVTRLPLKAGKKGYAIVQGGKTPYAGTQQEMVEGTYQNTINNTVQFAILKHGDLNTVNVVDALLNGEFVVILTNNSGEDEYRHQVYGLDAGLHASAMVRELYNDDTLAGWLVTLLEEGAPKAMKFVTNEIFNTLTEIPTQEPGSEENH